MFGAAPYARTIKTASIFTQKTAKLIGPVHQLYLLYRLIYPINFISPFHRSPNRRCN